MEMCASDANCSVETRRQPHAATTRGTTLIPTPEEAYELLKRYNSDPFHLHEAERHAPSAPHGVAAEA